jgi:hypothetical protein
VGSGLQGLDGKVDPDAWQRMRAIGPLVLHEQTGRLQCRFDLIHGRIRNGRVYRGKRTGDMRRRHGGAAQILEATARNR